MNETHEFTALTSNRETMYRFLSRIYRIEVDAPLLQYLPEMGFPTECDDPELGEGYSMMTACLRDLGSDALTDLAVDYARIFLGAGVFEGVVASPYESVYTSEERLIMQESRDKVASVYKDNELKLKNTIDIPEDHIALELEFMAHLCREAMKLDGDRERVLRLLAEQKDFIERHIMNWVPAFCADIEKCASTDFYRAVAKITRGFINIDLEILEDILKNYESPQ